VGKTVRVFSIGRSQAVRIPKELRFTSNEVLIRKEGNAVILEPLPEDWSWLDTISRPIDEDFLEAVAERSATGAGIRRLEGVNEKVSRRIT